MIGPCSSKAGGLLWKTAEANVVTIIHVRIDKGPLLGSPNRPTDQHCHSYGSKNRPTSKRICKAAHYIYTGANE